MVAAARYEVLPASPVRVWQGAFLLAHDVDEPRSLIVTVHGYGEDDAVTAVEGRNWFRSAQLEANFHYLEPARAGTMAVMPPLTHHQPVTRIVLVVRPFASPTRPAPELVSSFCFLATRGDTAGPPVVVSTHGQEVIDV